MGSFTTVEKSTTVSRGGLRALLGSTDEALALYRIVLGALLLSELILRFRFLHPFYSDHGTHPMRFVWPKVDELYHAVCLHCWSGSLIYQQLLLCIQVVCATFFTLGYKTRAMAISSWLLYLSLTLRNTWLNFILDRYFHYLLFYAMFLPLDRCWSIATPHRCSQDSTTIVVSVASTCLKLQLLWIYMDAGFGKYLDPLQGWTFYADPLPALDTYARHTLGARYLYAILRPFGLRLLTPVVVYVEILAIPLAFLGSYMGNATLVWAAVGLLCALHIGIAITLRNTVLLSLVACCACLIFLPIGWERFSAGGKQPRGLPLGTIAISSLLILSMVAGSIWLELFSASCDQSTKHIWSTLLHNRWNVFVGAEEYVTWEIAPGRLQDGTIVDVWGKKDAVDWRLPGTGAPCTSTSRPGRWRSFPYLAGIEGEEGDVLWRYLCDEWDRENRVDIHPERKLVEFNFFMLQADVLPDMGFSATRKRLIQSFQCVQNGNYDTDESTFSVDGKDEDTRNAIKKEPRRHVEVEL